MTKSTENSEQTAPQRPCGLPRRLIVIVYDGLVVTGMLLIAAAVALPLTGDRVQAGRDLLYTLYLLAVWFAYLGWCWSRAGQTIGMKAWRVRLVSEPGKPFTIGRALVRFAVSLVSAAALGAGFLHALLRRDRATWHDLASGTRLVIEPRPPKRPR